MEGIQIMRLAVIIAPVLVVCALFVVIVISEIKEARKARAKTNI